MFTLFDELEKLERKFERGFDDFINFGPSRYLSPVTGSSLIKYPCNFEESDDSVTFELALPGFKKEDIDIKVKGNHLVVSYDHEKSERESYWKRSFRRTFNIGENPDKEDVTAKFEDGILRIKVLKSKSSKTKTIKIA